MASFNVPSTGTEIRLPTRARPSAPRLVKKERGGGFLRKVALEQDTRRAS
jgi:hypothetical protein